MSARHRFLFGFSATRTINPLLSWPLTPCHMPHATRTTKPPCRDGWILLRRLCMVESHVFGMVL
jgi:hypothetical protein